MNQHTWDMQMWREKKREGGKMGMNGRRKNTGWRKEGE